MIKILIDNEEVVSDSTLQIKEEMLSTSSTILKNCYPKAWENTKDYTSNYYFPKDYSKCKIIGGQQTRTGTSFSFRSSDDYFDYKLLGKTGGTTGYQEINVCGKNLFDIDKCTKNKIINRDSGTTSTISNYAATDFIPIGENVTFTCTNFNVWYTACYDKNINR